MGGASAEITFVPEKGTVVPSSYSSYVRLYGRDYNLYTHSFLCYGMKEAERRLLASLVQVTYFSQHIMRPPGGSVSPCSLEKFPKSRLCPKMLFECSFKEMRNCSSESTLIPSSLEKFALVTINKNGKFPCSPYSPGASIILHK